ncbi:reverse transcriptase domain-containing protein [Herpetosiphon llansteffanensis]
MQSRSESTLLAQIASVDNLTRAWSHVRRNIRLSQRGRSHGPDAVTILDFEAAWIDHMQQLALELQSQLYRPLPPRRLFLAKRDGGKRTIAILAVRDRIAQRAVLQILEPEIEPTFLDCSYGFRPFVGVPHALTRIERYRQQGLQWVAHADISDCFGSIDHHILLNQLNQRIGDRAVIGLISQWLSVGVMDDAATVDASNWWDDGEDLLDRLMEHGSEMLWPSQPDYADLSGIYNQQLLDRGINRADSVRKRALQGLASNAALWSVSHSKQLLRGMRNLAPWLKRIPGGSLTWSAAGIATLAMIPLGQRLFRQRERGTLQGGAISPLLANIYLDAFDRAMIERGHSLVRFADDFVLLGVDQAAVEQALSDAITILKGLRLTTNANKTGVQHFNDGLTFLGHRFAVQPPSDGQRWETFQAAHRELKERLRKNRK